MAESVNRMPKAIQGCIWSMALVLAPLAFAADSLPDPTRPPDASNAPGSEYETGQVTGPMLQSVLVGPQRAEAIINGQLVKIGDKFGDARVVKIDESEVVLRNGKDVQKLKLFPGIEKRSFANRIDVKPGKGKQ
jgi:MSHA biogenesis protein MshK